MTMLAYPGFDRPDRTHGKIKYHGTWHLSAYLIELRLMRKLHGLPMLFHGFLANVSPSDQQMAEEERSTGQPFLTATCRPLAKCNRSIIVETTPPPPPAIGFVSDASE